MNFGKYKGKSIRKILEFDPQYIIWCINNIQNFEHKLDDCDKEMLGFFLNPFVNINLSTINFEQLMIMLKKRGILRSYSSFENNQDGEYNLKMDTCYGWRWYTCSMDNIFIDKKSIVINWINNQLNDLTK